MPRVLVITGFRCSGKETARKYLIQKDAYQDGIDVSDDILRPVADERGITEITGLLPLYMELGTDYFFDKIKQKADSVQGKIVVSSVRQLALYEQLKRRYGDELALLYLSAHGPARFQRRQARRRHGDIENYEDFIAFERKEMLFYKMAALFGNANLAIENNRTKEDLFRVLDSNIKIGKL